MTTALQKSLIKNKKGRSKHIVSHDRRLLQPVRHLRRRLVRRVRRGVNQVVRQYRRFLNQ